MRCAAVHDGLPADSTFDQDHKQALLEAEIGGEGGLTPTRVSLFHGHDTKKALQINLFLVCCSELIPIGGAASLLIWRLEFPLPPLFFLFCYFPSIFFIPPPP